MSYQDDPRALLICCVPFFLIAIGMIVLREFIAYTRAATGERLPRRRTGFAGKVGQSQKRYRELFSRQEKRARLAKQAESQYAVPSPPTQATGIQLDAQDFTYTGFEKYVGAMFEQNGFAVVHTGQTNDGGVDLRIYKNGKKGIVQCKRYDNSSTVGAKYVRDLRGAMIREAAIAGFLVTSSRFTAAARSEAEAVTSPRIFLIDGKDLAEWSKTGKIPC